MSIPQCPLPTQATAERARYQEVESERRQVSAKIESAKGELGGSHARPTSYTGELSRS